MLREDFVFELVPSKLEVGFTLISHLAAVLAVSFSGVSWLAKILLVMILSFYGSFCIWQIALKHSKKALVAFSLLKKDRCIYRLKNQKVCMAQLVDHFATSFLIILTVKAGSRVKLLVVFKDALPKAYYHALLCALKAR